MRRMLLLGVCVATLGCSSKNAPSPALKSMVERTDIVLVKNFYPETAASAPVRPREVSQPYHIETVWFPGSVRLQPIIVFEPRARFRRVKGIGLTVRAESYRVDAETGGGEEHESYLDENEARDLDAALTYQIATAALWAKHAPDHHTEVMFQSKDEFRQTLLMGDKGPVLLAVSGDPKGASVELPISVLPDLQKRLRQTLDVLDKN